MVNETSSPKPPPTSWDMAPAEPELAGQLVKVTRVFAAGLVGGAISLFSLGALVAPMTVQTCGASRSLRIDRERQALCMQLGITPEELAELEASGELPRVLEEAGIAAEQSP